MSDTPASTDTPPTKRCAACRQVLDIESFSVSKRTPDGRTNVCRLCVKDPNRPRLKRGGGRPGMWSESYAKAQAGAKHALEDLQRERDLEFIQLAIGTCLTHQHRQCYRCPTRYDGSDWFFELDEDDKIEGLVCPDCR